MSRRRSAEVGAPSDRISRKWCPSAVKRRMAGSTPAVEIEIALAEIAAPAGSRQDARRADHVLVVEQRLAHAHEHHAAHRVVGLGGDEPELRQDLPGLEAADAARAGPVAQKSQASAHPTCELRQTVYFAVGSASSDAACPARRRSRSARAASGSGSGMRTASIAWPSDVRNRYFTKPSAARRRSMTSRSGQLATRPPAPRSAACDRPRIEPGGKPRRAVAVNAREHPARDLGADPERRDRRRQLVAIEVAQVQQLRRRPSARR